MESAQRCYKAVSRTQPGYKPRSRTLATRVMDAFAAAPQCVNSDLVFVLEDSVALPGNLMPDACSVTAPLAAWPSNDPFDAVESWLASLDSADCESACPAARRARAAARVLLSPRSRTR